MDIAAIVARRLKDWVKSLTTVDIEESATWFLLLLIYAHGLTKDDLGFRWSGVIPEITPPQVILVMVLLCLVVSAVVLIEPVLPSKMRKWTKDTRHSALGQYIRLIGVLFAFILGLMSGVSLLLDKVPTFSWLIVPLVCVGFAIFLLLVIRLIILWIRFIILLGRPDRDSSADTRAKKFDEEN